DKIFNYKVFEKWEMYNRMKKFKEVKPFLPVTEVYKDDVQLIDLINKYNDVYVKPIGGRGGKGIYNILKIDEEKYKIKTTVGKNITEQVYENLNEVKNFFISNFQKDKYIIQQTIDVKNNNKVFDFRVGYDKDLYGNWNRIMFVTRVGGNNSVVSNYKAGGSLMYPEDALKEFYNLSDEKVEEYKEKIFKVGDIILNALEKTSKHFGKVALDLIMDKNGGVWLVEINMRYPDDTLKNSLDDDRETYKKIRLTNMQYCKYLSGFSNKNNPTNVSIDNKIDEGQSQHSYKIYFYGKVQGVNFRKTLKRIGNEEKIDVKATNLKNKHIVKAEITVEDSTLEKFISKAKSENKKAKVNSISIIKNNH
ncbi:YheC/YheD family protein, partial [Piscibacillus halophilus]|uniref:YheC/YheD family protein n=1 Tax=Piscibacillus halophilus TaxID=571933 RepID=UPI00158DA785